MPGYQTRIECVPIDGLDGLVIRSLLNKQQFSDPLGSAARLGISSAAWPLFGQLWPSGLRLAACIGQRPVIGGETILEIGCGLALASLVAHRCGADVTASDGHPLARRFLAANLRLNALAPMKYLHGQWPQTAGRHKLFNLIIGSDILYERDVAGSLPAFIQQHALPGAQVWIVDPDRANRPAFNRRMAALGFALQQQWLDVPATAASAAYKGRLLKFNRPASRPAL